MRKHPTKGAILVAIEANSIPVNEDDVELTVRNSIAHMEDLVVIGQVHHLDLDVVGLFGRKAM